jgi:hypothetical protein
MEGFKISHYRVFFVVVQSTLRAQWLKEQEKKNLFYE